MNRSVVNSAKLCAWTLAMVAIATLVPSTATAATLEIQLGGVDIGYDGTNLYDDDPGSADPDPLNTVTFLVDSVMVGSVLTSDVSLDIFIPSVLGIADTGDIVVSAAGGDFDLGLPSGDFLDLVLDAATITYLDLAGTIQFAFGGSIAGITGQSLPFGLAIGEPVSVSFSTQINAGSLFTSLGTVDAFTASGTGEIRGPAGPIVPEPSAIALAALGFVGLAGWGWRRRKCAFRYRV